MLYLPPSTYIISFALLIAVLSGVFVWRRLAVQREAREIYALRKSEGTLEVGVDEATYTAAWERTYGPRALGYTIIAATALAVLFPLLSWIFNSFWSWLWINGMLIEAIEPGTIIHGFTGAVVVVGACIGLIAWPLMRRYQMKRPQRFETELKRELQGG